MSPIAREANFNQVVQPKEPDFLPNRPPKRRITAKKRFLLPRDRSQNKYKYGLAKSAKP